MKFSLSNRQKKEYLVKADEIFLQYRDIAQLTDLIDNYPQADIAIEIPNNTNIDWDLIQTCSNYMQKNLYCCLYNLYASLNECKSRGLKYFYYYPVESFYDLRGLKELGVSQVKVSGELFFDMDAVKAVGIPLRLVPNLAYSAYIQRKDGICGQWIRPEDIDLYEPYAEICEFVSTTLPMEQTLYELYANKKEWLGDLSMIIKNLNVKIKNAGVFDEAMKYRLNCRQKCQRDGRCHLCTDALNFGDVVNKYKESKQDKADS